MQISINAKHFKDCLEVVEKAIPVRSTIPVINNILFEIDNNSLTVSATNLEMYIKASMIYEGTERGKILLPPKIVDIMRYFPTDQVIININWDNYRIDISGGSANFHLYGSDSEDYPLSFDISLDQEKAISIEQKKIKDIIKSVVFAASNEETRPAFKGILFYFNKNKLSLTASDTYRLAITELSDNKWAFEEKLLLVPAKAMREILRVLGDDSLKVKIFYERNILAFKLEEVYFAARLLEEKYPDVSGVIPKEYKTRIIVDCKELDETITRAALLAEGKNHAVNMKVTNNKLEASASGQEGSMEEFIPVEQDGEDVEVIVNTRFVIDILKFIDQKKIIMDFHGEGGPIIFRLVDDKSYLYLVLPIKKVN